MNFNAKIELGTIYRQISFFCRRWVQIQSYNMFFKTFTDVFDANKHTTRQVPSIEKKNILKCSSPWEV